MEEKFHDIKNEKAQKNFMAVQKMKNKRNSLAHNLLIEGL